MHIETAEAPAVESQQNPSGHKNPIKQKVKFENFIGIFPNVITDETCQRMLNWFNLCSEHNLTMSSMEEHNNTMLSSERNDEILFMPASITHHCFPINLGLEIWTRLHECYEIYNTKYNLDQKVVSYSWKVHRVQVSGGYHQWHHEHHYRYATRVIAWMLILEAPKRGGETEFLHQSMRIEPKVKQLTMWPAGFTHKHRGNPPLEGQKTYITGWFDVTD